MDFDNKNLHICTHSPSHILEDFALDLREESGVDEVVATGESQIRAITRMPSLSQAWKNVSSS